MVYERIILPTNLERVAQLNAKLVEYRQRLEKKTTDVDVEVTWNTICKVVVLETLLQDTKVDDDMAIRNKLSRYGVVDWYPLRYCLRAAFEVIGDYCDTGGQYVKDGTGLSSVVQSA